MTSSTPPTETRLQLVKTNRAAIYAALCRAARDGKSIGDAVVVVADSADPFGCEIAEAASRQYGAILDQQPSTTDRLEDGPSTVIVVTIATARLLFAQSHPRIASSLDRQPSPGCARVVAIAEGTPVLIHADIRPNAIIAQG